MKKKNAQSGLNARVIAIYWRHTMRYRWLFALNILAIICLQATLLATPWYLRKFFNTLGTNTPSPVVVQTLVGILGIIVLIWFTGWACRRVLIWAQNRFEIRTMTDLYHTEFEYLLGHSHNFFISRFGGSLTHKVTKFVRAYEALGDDFIGEFFPTMLFIGGAIIVLFFRNHTLGIALFLWAIVFCGFQLWVARLRQPIRVARAAADTKVTATVADAIANHSNIALFTGTQNELSILSSVVATWRTITLRSWDTDDMIWGALGIFMITIQIGLLYGAVMFWNRGLLTIGDFVLIQTYLLTTFDRLVNINRAFRRFFDAFSDAGEMVELLDMSHDIQDVPGAKDLKVSMGAITFNDVDFYFNETRPILQHYNLSITGGEKIAFVGPSGAGKTTVTRLLLRLYDVADGKIDIDGQNIAHVTQESLRNAIAFVPQEPVLFHRTLMDNIRYGRRDATDAEVMEAARQAHCDEFISALPLKYQTFVGERGVKLSGGERQRVAIARALLKNAPILILDEATSSLDSESESLIQDALKTLMKGKTVIVIAHRLSTIMNMDRIVVMDAGGIVSQGTHTELLSENGLYAKLWSIQAGGFMGDLAEKDEIS